MIFINTFYKPEKNRNNSSYNSIEIKKIEILILYEKKKFLI